MLIVSTAMLTIFGFPYMTLLAGDRRREPGGSVAQVGRAVSVLMAFNGFGALVGALVVASLPATTPRQPRHPVHAARVRRCSSSASRSRAPSGRWRVFSMLAGAALMATNSLALTSIQSAVPGHLRGRVMALFVMAFMGIMPFSALDLRAARPGRSGRRTRCSAPVSCCSLGAAAHRAARVAALHRGRARPGPPATAGRPAR